jgi:hypothetical protein
MTREDQRVELERLEPFLGEWRLEVEASWLPPDLADAACTTFEWTLGGAFLLRRAFVPVPEAPDGLCVIGPDEGDGYRPARRSWAAGKSRRTVKSESSTSTSRTSG